MTGRNKRSDTSSTKSCDNEIAPRRHGEKFDSRSSTKKGDREDAGNYRLICSLLVLYMLFATILYARLAPSLHKVQPADQGGFRPNHKTASGIRGQKAFRAILQLYPDQQKKDMFAQQIKKTAGYFDTKSESIEGAAMSLLV